MPVTEIRWPGELRTSEAQVQRACGIGLLVLVLQAMMVAVLANVLYPRWWLYLVGPGLLLIALGTAVTCLRGISRASWRYAAVALWAVGVLATAMATAESTVSVLTAVAPVVTALVCLVGVLDRPVIGFSAGGVLLASQLIGAVLSRPSDIAGVVAVTIIQAALLIAAGAASGFIHRVARSQVEAQRGLTEALTVDRAAVESYSDCREQQRVLHDTVLNTLTALSRPGLVDSAGLRDRCGHDARYLRSLHLAAAHDEAELGGGGTEPGLVEGLKSLAELASNGEFDVVLDIDESVAALPRTVEHAFLRAAREAIANAREHAGADSLRLLLNTDGDRVQVELVDRGVGMGTDAPGYDRLGIRRSIIERLSDVGGRATIGEQPGGGTRVVLTWPA